MNEATEQYIARLLEEAPPLTPEQSALIVRAFARTTRNTTDTSSPVSDAA